MHQRSLEALTVVPVEAFSPKPMNETQQLLATALARLEGGKRWGKHALENKGAYCALGVVNLVMCGDAENTQVGGPKTALIRAAKSFGRGILDINNNAESFDEVEALFKRAIELAA
jgi:hypothetical protein